MVRSRFSAAIFSACLMLVAPFAALAQQTQLITDENRQVYISVMQERLAGLERLENLATESRNSGAKNVYLPQGLGAYVEENTVIFEDALEKLRAGRPVSSARMKTFLDAQYEAGGSGMEELLARFAGYRIPHILSDALPDSITIELPDGPASIPIGKSAPPAEPFIVPTFLQDADGVWQRTQLSLPDMASAEQYLDKAAEWRQPSLRVGHLLGAVTVQTHERDEARNDLLEQIVAVENEIASTQRILDNIDAEIAQLQAEFQVEAGVEEDRLAPFEAAVTEAEARLAPGSQPSPAEASDPRDEDAAMLFEQQRRRLAQIKEALAYLFAEENENGSSEFTRARIQKLDLERAEIEDRMDAENAAPIVVTPSASPEARARYEEARARYQSEAFISHARLRSLAIGFIAKEKVRLGLLDELAAHEADLVQLEARLAAMGGEELPLFSSLETADAHLLFDPGARDEIARLNELIAAQIKRLRDAERRHHKASVNVLRHANTVAETSLDERNSVIGSYVAQALFQWSVQTLDNLEASGGDPVVFFAMAASQMVANRVNIPKFYDADIDRETGELFIANMPPDRVRATQDTATSAGTAVLRPVGEQLGIDALKAALGKAGGSATLAELAALSSMRSIVGDMAAKTPASVKGASVVRAVLIDHLTEAGKARLASVLQEEDVRAHITAQEALSQALASRTLWSDMRDLDRELLDHLLEARAQLHPGTEPAGRVQRPGVRIDHNNHFDPVAGYALTLDIEGEDKTTLSQIQLQLAGIDLEPGTAPGRFLISAAAAEALQADDTPEALPVTIRLEWERQ